MMKLVDMLGLGSSEETLEGSSPSIRNIFYYPFFKIILFLLIFIFSILKFIEVLINLL
jgi:hypothetical protein